MAWSGGRGRSPVVGFACWVVGDRHDDGWISRRVWFWPLCLDFGRAQSDVGVGQCFCLGLGLCVFYKRVMHDSDPLGGVCRRVGTRQVVGRCGHVCLPAHSHARRPSQNTPLTGALTFSRWSQIPILSWAEGAGPCWASDCCPPSPPVVLVLVLLPLPAARCLGWWGEGRVSTNEHIPPGIHSTRSIRDSRSPAGRRRRGEAGGAGAD